MTTVMRAKLEVSSVNSYAERIELDLNAVCGDKPFGEDGLSEDNTFSKWTPSANMVMTITNPDLFGKFEVGDKFYVDFIKAN